MVPGCARLIIMLLGYILPNNYFLFGDLCYKQRKGTAIGSNVALIYAIIFMAVLEDSAMYALGLFSHVQCWLRYINDIFLVWDGTEEDLVLFHA